MTDPAERTEAEWRQILTDEQFRITRRKDTERAFTGEYWETETPGLYRCVCCGEPLFDSETKFDSGTGWPSFYDIAESSTVTRQPDYSGGLERTEVVCGRCGAHLGHVFDDGPPPTNLRYCINSVSLKLEPRQ